MSSDRNLLIGLIALRNGLASREHVLDAMQDWLLEKSTSLDMILVEKGVISERDRASLGSLVDRHIESNQGSLRESLTSLGVDTTLQADRSAAGSNDITQALSQIPTQAPAPSATAAASGATGETRYRPIQLHATGGIGKVSLAIDRELNRQVALKEILDKHADDEESRARFNLEAEITGGLEHPGIVPVYGLGQYPDGRPYYAMRFIKGDTFHDAIKQYHASAPGMSATEKSLGLRKLLRRFVDICNAVDYAHSKHVIHRDLKPGNVMLGDYGETLVVDWGLAKRTDDPKEPSRSQSSFLEEIARSDETPATKHGSVFGTPAFMSPEQAAGKTGELGPATDVYSLGATLFNVLTGVTPIDDVDLSTALERVREGLVHTPSSVKSDVPRALEAICVKAMAVEPCHRYDNPKQLAEDIERWLADEPVSAWKESIAIRLSRWVRTHQPFVSSLAVTVLLGAVSLGVLAAVMTAARDREASTNGLLEKTNTALRETVGELTRANRNEAKAKADALSSAAMAHLRSAWEAYDRGDRPQALLWLSEAQRTTESLAQSISNGLQISPEQKAGIARRRQVIRMGLDSLRAQFPLAQLWPHGRAACFSADGSWYAVGGNNGAVRVVDSKSGKPLGATLELDGPVLQLQFSSDNRHLLAVSAGQGVRLLDLQSRQLRRLTSGTDIRSAQFHRNDSRILAVAANGTLSVWDTGGELLSETPNVLAVNSRQTRCLTRTASSDDGQTIQLYDLEQERPLGEPRRLQQLSQAIFSGDGLTLIALAKVVSPTTPAPALAPMTRSQTPQRDPRHRQQPPAGQARVAEPAQNQNIPNQSIEFQSGNALQQSSSPSTRKTTSLLVWDATTGEIIHEREDLLSNDEGATVLALSRDGRRLAVRTGRTQIGLWDFVGTAESPTDTSSTTRRYLTTGIPPLCLSFSPDAKYLLAGCGTSPATIPDLLDEPGQVLVWDLETGAQVVEGWPHSAPVTSIEMSRQDLILATGDLAGPGECRAWDFAAYLRPIQKLEPEKPFSHKANAAFTPDGKQIILYEGDRTVGWDSESKTRLPITEPMRARKTATRLVCSYRATASNPIAFTAATGIKRVRTHGRWITKIAEQTYETRAALLPNFPKQEPQPLKEFLTGEHYGIVCNGKFFVTDKGKSLGEVLVWDSLTGRPITRPLRHEYRVPEAFLSEDGKYVCTVANDEAIRVWDVATSMPISPPLRSHLKLKPIAFRNDARQLLLVSVHDDYIPAEDMVDAGKGIHGIKPPEERVRELPPHALYVWDLFALTNSDKVSAAPAEVLSGSRVDASGKLERLKLAEIQKAWQDR